MTARHEKMLSPLSHAAATTARLINDACERMQMEKVSNCFRPLLSPKQREGAYKLSDAAANQVPTVVCIWHNFDTWKYFMVFPATRSSVFQDAVSTTATTELDVPCSDWWPEPSYLLPQPVCCFCTQRWSSGQGACRKARFHQPGPDRFPWQLLLVWACQAS